MARGHVRKRGKTWTIVYDLPRDSRTGHRTQKWKGGFETKVAAETALRRALAQLDDGFLAELPDQTLGDYLFEHWLPTIEPTVKRSTYLSYYANVDGHIVPRLGGYRMRQLSPVTLNAFYMYLLKEGRKDGRGGLAPKTVHYIHTIIHKALKDAVRWQLLHHNPATSANPPRRTQKATGQFKVWTMDQVAAFLEATTSDRLHSAYVVAATTGLRRGELLGLRWSDVNLEKHTLTISQTLVSANYEVIVTSTKTRGSRRSVPLDKTTARSLADHRLKQLQERLAAGADWQETEFVFTSLTGTHLHPDAFSKAFGSRIKSAGLPLIRLHDLRHTFATMALSNGWNPKVVSERLGHSSVVVTLDLYSHVLPSLQEEMIEDLADRLFGT